MEGPREHLDEVVREGALDRLVVRAVPGHALLQEGAARALVAARDARACRAGQGVREELGAGLLQQGRLWRSMAAGDGQCTCKGPIRGGGRQKQAAGCPAQPSLGRPTGSPYERLPAGLHPPDSRTSGCRISMPRSMMSRQW